jgi:cell division protein FtsL
MSNNPSISIPQALVGIILTVLITFGGSYLALRDGGVERRTKIEYLEHQNAERKAEIKELKEEIKELRDGWNKDVKEMLRMLADIQKELQNKENRRAQ